MAEQEKQGATILLVDDDSAMTAYLRTALELQGYRILVARGGADGVRCFNMHRAEIRLVLADMIMPDMSGIELRQCLAAEGDTTPIMFIAAFANERTRTQVMQAGAVSFLFKPFTATALIDGLRQALGEWKPTVH